MESCCICLDSPLKKDPLKLISCGCKGAWFHKECELLFMTSIDKDITPICPVCRRDIPIQTCYNFSHTSVWLMVGVSIIEIPIGIHFNTCIILIQGSILLAYPFIVPFSKDILFFIHHYTLQVLFDLICICGGLDNLGLLLMIRYAHILFLAFFIDRDKKDPLTPFITGYELLHSSTLEYVPLIPPKPAANSLKGNKVFRRGRRKRSGSGNR